MKFNKVFIFSTGRCGSQSIAESLQLDGITKSFHEPSNIRPENLLHYFGTLENPKQTIKNE